MGSMRVWRGILVVAVVVAALGVTGVQPSMVHAQVPASPVSAGGPYAGQVGALITLEGVASVGVAAARWHFSDDTSLPGLTVTKTFAAPGSYTATLWVVGEDNRVYSGSATITISSAAPPPVAPPVLVATSVTVPLMGLDPSSFLPSGVSVLVPVLRPCHVVVGELVC